MNAGIGCEVKISYNEMTKHMTECEYATLKCSNYGCEKEMFKKDYTAHAQSCEFKIKKCKKCDFKLAEGVEECDDCIINMKKRYENLENKYFNLA